MTVATQFRKNAPTRRRRGVSILTHSSTTAAAASNSIKTSETNNNNNAIDKASDKTLITAVCTVNNETAAAVALNLAASGTGTDNLCSYDAQHASTAATVSNLIKTNINQKTGEASEASDNNNIIDKERKKTLITATGIVNNKSITSVTLNLTASDAGDDNLRPCGTEQASKQDNLQGINVYCDKFDGKAQPAKILLNKKQIGHQVVQNFNKTVQKQSKLKDISTETAGNQAVSSATYGGNSTTVCLTDNIDTIDKYTGVSTINSIPFSVSGDNNNFNTGGAETANLSRDIQVTASKICNTHGIMLNCGDTVQQELNFVTNNHKTKLKQAGTSACDDNGIIVNNNQESDITSLQEFNAVNGTGTATTESDVTSTLYFYLGQSHSDRMFLNNCTDIARRNGTALARDPLEHVKLKQEQIEFVDGCTLNQDACRKAFEKYFSDIT